MLQIVSYLSLVGKKIQENIKLYTIHNLSRLNTQQW